MNRVVVTGYGSITPLGHSAETTWRQVTEGQSGIAPITLFDTTNFIVKLAAEVKNLDPLTIVEHKEIRRLDRFQLLAHAAAAEAVQHSGLELGVSNGSRIGVAVSSGAGGIMTLDDAFRSLHEQGPRAVGPFAVTKFMSNGAAGNISITYGLTGPCFSVGSACASGADGIGLATSLIRSGTVDAMVAGGADAPVTGLTIAAFDRIGAISHKTESTPSPFSADRDGLIVGEGAAVLVLESLDHARARGASIHAEIVGYGASADAYHITAPTGDGSGSATAIQRALDDAHLDPTAVDYINAHGTGTSLNDEAETKAIKRVFKDRAYSLPVSSTKSMTGHMMGATGAVEAVISVQAIRDSVVPPTINYLRKDSACDLDYVPNEARELPVRIVVSNSFGFGGHNAVLVIQRYEP